MLAVVILAYFLEEFVYKVCTFFDFWTISRGRKILFPFHPLTIKDVILQYLGVSLCYVCVMDIWPKCLQC